MVLVVQVDPAAKTEFTCHIRSRMLHICRTGAAFDQSKKIEKRILLPLKQYHKIPIIQLCLY